MKSRGPNRNVESWHDPDELSESREMVSHRNVGRRYWKIASTGVTRTSQPNTQLDLMDNHFEDFSQSTQGQGMRSLLMVMSKGRHWSGKFRTW